MHGLTGKINLKFHVRTALGAEKVFRIGDGSRMFFSIV